MDAAIAEFQAEHAIELQRRAEAAPIADEIARAHLELLKLHQWGGEPESRV